MWIRVVSQRPAVRLDFLTIPPGTGPGYYYVLAQADSANAVAESQEGNNTWYASIRIDP